MKKIAATPFLFCCALFILNAGCGIYKFQDVTIDPEIKTVRVGFIDNRAPYVNAQLSPNLTDRLKQKIRNQTKLTETQSDKANLDIQGYITDYSVSTTGVSSADGRSQTSINRLTVAVHLTVTNQTNPNDQPRNVDVSRSFDFSANKSLQSAESELLDEMVRNLTDEIFNHIFSNW